MSPNQCNSAEEVQRRNNICNFLDGLLDEDETNGSIENIQVKDVVQEEHNEKNGLTQGQAVWPTLDRYEFAVTKYLPIDEIRCYRDHMELFASNIDNILVVPFSIHLLKHSDILVNIYSGIPSAKAFFALADMFKKEEMKYAHGWVVGQLSMKQQLLLTTMKLKLGMTDVHLSQRFNCSLETVENTVLTWIFALSGKLLQVTVGMVESLRERSRPDTPSFIHAISVTAKTPKNPHIPHQTPMETFKSVLISTTDGIVLFSTELFSWTTSNVEIVKRCEGLEWVLPGEVVTVDPDLQLGLLQVHGEEARAVKFSRRRIKAAQTDVEKRLMMFSILQNIPENLLEYGSTILEVCSMVMNYGRLLSTLKEEPA